MFCTILFTVGCDKPPVDPGHGNIGGTVTADGTPLVGVSVAMGGNTLTQTDARGEYFLAALEVGTKVLTFSKAGYTTQTATASVVKDQMVTLDVAMTSGSTTQPGAVDHLVLSDLPDGPLFVGESIVVHCTAYDANNNTVYPAITWAASGAVTVTDGSVKAGSAGTGTITATANGKSASSAITVRAIPATPTYKRQWGGIEQPRHLAVSADGYVFVNQNMTKGRKYDLQGTLAREFAVQGDGGVAISGTSVYWGAHDQQRITVTNSNGDVTGGWGSVGTGNGQFQYILGVATASNNVYILEGAAMSSRNQRIQKFAGDTYVATIGSFGSGQGQLYNAYGIFLDGDLYVADTGNNRVQVLSTAGQFKTSWSVPGPTGIACKNGVAYVVSGNKVIAYSKRGFHLFECGGTGTGVGQFQNAYGIALSAADEIFISDFNSGKISVFK